MNQQQTFTFRADIRQAVYGVVTRWMDTSAYPQAEELIAALLQIAHNQSELLLEQSNNRSNHDLTFIPYAH